MARNLQAKLRRAAITNGQKRQAILDTKADELAKIFLSAENQIQGLLVGEISGPQFTSSRVESLTNQIDTILAQQLTQPGTAWVESNLPELYNLGIEQGARTYTAQTAVSVFDQVPSLRVRETFLNFTETTEYQGILQSGFRKWLGEIQLTDQAMLTSIRDVLTEGTILGLDNKTIVNNLLEDGKLKPLVTSDGRHLSAETRARGIVRTEGTRSIVQSEVSVNLLSGLDAYVDIGIKDEVTSGICRVSQRQIPHTLGWWESSPLGIPPRHVQNCRDELMAIILSDFTLADAKALGIKGYNPALFVLDNGTISSGEARRLKKEIGEAEKIAA